MQALMKAHLERSPIPKLREKQEREFWKMQVELNQALEQLAELVVFGSTLEEKQRIVLPWRQT